MTRILSIVLPILILVIVGVGGVQLVSSFAPEPEEASEPPQALSVFGERTREIDLQLTVSAQGEVRPRREIAIAPQIVGRVEYVSPDLIDGGFIAKGQVLARLEAADYELAMVRARAIVASAEQNLVREMAEADIARQDLAELGVDNASPLARREPQLADAEAALASARAQLRDAELALERTSIRAPFDGRVREKAVDVGQFVAAGQSLGSIFATDLVEVVLPITDDELGRIGLPIAFAETAANPGPAVVFRASVAGKPREWEGRIVRTAAAVNTQSRLINVVGEVRDPYGAGADDGAPMAPGLFVTAEIEGASVPNVIWAPRPALHEADKLYVGDIENNVLDIRTVEVVFSDDEGAYITDGVGAGELAIVSPIQAAFDGMRLNILERAPDGTIIEREDDGSAVDAQAVAGAASTDQQGRIQ